jgi:non-ribosomal peptide synthetase component E (peptide arylation enzyme)
LKVLVEEAKAAVLLCETFSKDADTHRLAVVEDVKRADKAAKDAATSLQTVVETASAAKASEVAAAKSLTEAKVVEEAVVAAQTAIAVAGVPGESFGYINVYVRYDDDYYYDINIIYILCLFRFKQEVCKERRQTFSVIG